MQNMRHNVAVDKRIGVAVNDDTCEMFFDEAVSLAYQHFDEPTDDHIVCVFERLIWNWGGSDGAVTVH